MSSDFKVGLVVAFVGGVIGAGLYLGACALFVLLGN